MRRHEGTQREWDLVMYPAVGDSVSLLGSLPITVAAALIATIPNAMPGRL
jgi:hypothetical protein